MKSKPSQARTFPSRYAPGTFISVGQWLAEFMCGRQAAAKGQELPTYFWKIATWEKKYAQQARAAASLLRLYSEKAIGAALRTKQGQKVLSLSAPWFDDLVKEEQRKLDLAAAEQAALPPPPPAPPPPAGPVTGRPTLVKGRSLWDKLEGL